ncbi:MAG: hypothetical protein V4662_16310 [Verrucomicrobiota bacterium]
MMMRFLVLPLLAACSVHAGPFGDIKLDMEKLHAALREAALKVEEKHSPKHPEPRGLAGRVESILNMPVPEKRDREGDALLASEMTLQIIHFGINPSLGGHSGMLVDKSQKAQAANYHRLEALQTEGEADVMRWLQMTEAAGAMKDEEKKSLCQDKAVAAARALISREPGNPQAHALLADALGWRAGLEEETLKSLKQALKLAPNHLLARYLMYRRTIDQVSHETFSRQTSRLEDRLGGMFDNLTKSNTNPLTEEEMNALKGRVEKFVGECDTLMKESVAAEDFVTFCRVWESQVEFLQMAVIAKLPRQAPAGTSEETLRAVFMQEGVMKPMGQVLCHTAESGVALKLAGNDAARAGAVAICHAMGVFFKAAGSGQPPAPDNLKFVQLAMQRLNELARQSQETEAARAYEAIAMLDVFMGMITQKEPENLDALIESLKRDPEGYLTLTLLMGLSKDRDGSKSAYALAEIQNAILPSVANRKMCAAGAAQLEDWDAAFRHLDILRNEAPDDLEIKGQRVVTLMRQSQSKVNLDKAAALYADINADTILDKTASLEADTRSMITRNYILFLALRHQKENTLALLNRAQEAKVVKPKDAEEIRELLSK